METELERRADLVLGGAQSDVHDGTILGGVHMRTLAQLLHLAAHVGGLSQVCRAQSAAQQWQTPVSQWATCTLPVPARCFGRRCV